MASRDLLHADMRPAFSSKSFDPYHKWLGIPPGEQPPNSYRLLGLAIYEDDAEVIAAAADRQMAHVKCFATGQNSAESQQILNELARARVTLLNARQKQRYDEQLNHALKSPREVMRAAATQVHSRPDLWETDSEPSVEFGWPPAARPMVPSTRIFQRKRRNPTGFVLLLFVPLCLAGGVILMLGRNADSIQLSKSTSLPRPIENLRPTSPQPTKPGLEADADSKSDQSVPSLVTAPPDTPSVITDDGSDAEDNDAEVTPADPKVVAHSIDLNLESRVQRYDLPVVSTSRIVVASLEGCKEPSSIAPAESILEKTSKVTISVEGPREVYCELSLREQQSDKKSILVRYYVFNDEGKELAFTLAAMDRVCREISKQGRAAVAAFDSMQSEQARLQRWIASPITKPLAEVGLAKARILELNAMASDQSALIETLKADLEVAEEMSAFAQHLQDDCAIIVELTH